MSEPSPDLPARLTPELLEGAQRQINEEAIHAGLCEIRGTGGLELSHIGTKKNNRKKRNTTSPITPTTIWKVT